MKTIKWLVAFLLVSLPITTNATVEVDERLGEYLPALSYDGKIRAVGPASFESVMVAWGDEFVAYHPDINFGYQASDPLATIDALIERNADMIVLDRKMTKGEIDFFKDTFGYRPLAVPVTRTVKQEYAETKTFFVYVNKHPLKRLSRAQIEFLGFVHSKEGQVIASESGYAPLTSRITLLYASKIRN